MKLIPLGGAEEVGATCTLVEIGGHRILVDAGIRIGQPDSLPDLGRISDFGGIEAILVTHAHTDHTGALPVVHRSYPAVPLYATPGTQAIVNVLFNDALNIMKNRYEVDREIPLYNRELVDSLFSRMQPVQLGQTIRLFGGDVAATFFPAGHILGAACIGLQSANGESAFISGDISVTPQLTVGGMLPPVSVDKKFRPQVVMVESTYGNRMHANRATEERRLIETISEIVESGGRVLIPAFAVGRAQEVLLILASAMSRKSLAPFPVWVDGMVRSVCGVYTQHPYDLNTALRRQILRSGNPFFGDSAGKTLDFISVTTGEERKKIAEEAKPGVIVASSGMLSGGPSAFYARYIAKESKSAIFITGYQDEESPGRALLALAETSNPAERVLKLEGETVNVACQVGKYSLSAHVDAGEVAGLIEQLNPQETVLVHGAGGAREALSDLLMQTRERRVYLPRAADELTFAGRKKARKPQVADVPKLLEGVPPSAVYALLPTAAEELLPLRQKLIEQLGEKAVIGRALTVQEVAQLWMAAQGHPEAVLSADDYGRFRALLNETESGFKPDVRRPFLYRVIKLGETKIEKEAEKEKAKAEQFPLEQNNALKIVDELFPPTSGLYKKGAYTSEQRLLLSFNFPEVAVREYADKLEDLATRTGWGVVLNQEANQNALQDAVTKILPPVLQPTKVPSIHREVKAVRVSVAYRDPQAAELSPDALQTNFEAVRLETANKFKAATGYELAITQAATPAVPVTVAPTGEKMEINATFAYLDRVFNERGVRLLKRSLKFGGAGQFIELSFMTGQAGQKQLDFMRELETQIGWVLQVNPEPQNQALEAFASTLIKAHDNVGLNLRKFSLRKEIATLTVKADAPVTEAEGASKLDITKLNEEFTDQTGWTLKLEIQWKI
jgi:uncharacterized protein